MERDVECEVIRKRDLEPGDIVLLKVKTGEVSPMLLEQMLKNMERFLEGYGVKVIGCPDYIDLEIYGRKK